MSRDWRYSTGVCERMRSFPGAGRLDGAGTVLRARAGDPERGGCVEFDCRIDGHRIAEARFRAFGCPHLVAAASWLSEWLCGADREALMAWNWQEVAEALDVPPAKYGRLLLLQDALREVAGNWPDPTRSTV